MRNARPGTRSGGAPCPQKLETLRRLPGKDILIVNRASAVEMLCSRKPKATFKFALAEAQMQEGIACNSTRH